MASQLMLNPEVIKERSTSYSSLTDLYEVPIFTNQFEKTIEDYQEKSSERNSTLYQTVFTLEDWKAKDTNLQLQEYLFVGNESKKVMEQTNADENNGTSIYIKSGSILVIGFLVILFYRYKKRNVRRREKEHADNNNASYSYS